MDSRDESGQGFPDGFFARVDDGDDDVFYAVPRLVTHIDDDAIAAVGDLYDELGIDGDVLDLMSSWVSHFRSPPKYLRVLGMNARELDANPIAAERMERGAIVAEYFRRSRVFASPAVARRTPPGHRGDPLFAVWAARLSR